MIRKRTLLAPTSIYDIDLNLDNDQLIKDIQSHRNNFPEGELSNVKAWRSSYKTHQQTKLFDKYIDKILGGVEQARIFDPQSFSKLQVCTYEVMDFWALMYEEGDYTVNHSHFPFTWALVYYAYADEDSSPIQFKSLRIKPKSGMLLLWPGSLYHSVPHTKGKRIAVSANLMIRDFGK